MEYPGEISCWISLVPRTDEGVSEGEQSALCGEIGKSASCEFPVCKPHYSTVIIIIILIGLIFISQTFNLVVCVGGVSVC